MPLLAMTVRKYQAELVDIRGQKKKKKKGANSSNKTQKDKGDKIDLARRK